jgi:murein DD-endopeptidase MepM/ murein hydrolase activator NlpD
MIEPYPYILFSAGMKPAPLFRHSGDPYRLCLSSDNEQIRDLDPTQPSRFQDIIDRDIKGRYTWGLSPYLEKRDRILRHFPQMVSEKRFYHLGVDILLEENTPLFAPLTGSVTEAGYEEGMGNYGGHVILEHSMPDRDPFFTLYGHLDPGSIPTKGKRLKAGDLLGRIGGFSVNGGWYTHTHLQIITCFGAQEGFLYRGYCSEKDLKRIHLLCPSPIPLLIGSII